MMDIVFCIDDNYVIPCGVAMTSLFENNDGYEIMVHIIGMNLSESKAKELEQIICQYNSTINFYNIEEEYINSFNFAFDPEITHLNIAAYIRLFVAEILPSDIDKILYLDSDLIIVDNLSELWNTPMKDYSTAGVVDRVAFKRETYTRLNYPEIFSYINSGVLLINLNYWRENDVLGKFIDYEKKNHSNIEIHDQDVINGVLYSSILLLPVRYNMQSPFYFRKREFIELGEDIGFAIKNPAIIHFTILPKPWIIGSFHPETKCFINYKNISLFKNVPREWDKKITFGKKVKYYKRTFLYSLKLTKSKYIQK